MNRESSDDMVVVVVVGIFFFPAMPDDVLMCFLQHADE